MIGRRFLSLMEGAPRNSWESILSFNSECADHIFGYDVESASLCDPPPEASWVLKWVLLHYSGKHRFLSSKRADLAWLSKDSWDSMQRYLWRLHFQKYPSSPSVVKTRKDSISDCGTMVGSLPQRWLTHFRRVLLDTANANAQRFPQLKQCACIW
jgi:hypothetical protein